MSRYWVNLGNWEIDFCPEESDEDRRFIKRIEEVKERLLALDNRVNYDLNTYSLVFKTHDLKEAKEIASKSIHIIKQYDEDWVSVSITRQPECPNCRKLGRFSDVYCNVCGTELIGSYHIEAEDIEAEKVTFS